MPWLTCGAQTQTDPERLPRGACSSACGRLRCSGGRPGLAQSERLPRGTRSSGCGAPAGGFGGAGPRPSAAEVSWYGGVPVSRTRLARCCYAINRSDFAVHGWLSLRRGRMLREPWTGRCRGKGEPRATPRQRTRQAAGQEAAPCRAARARPAGRRPGAGGLVSTAVAARRGAGRGGRGGQVKHGRRGLQAVRRATGGAAPRHGLVADHRGRADGRPGARRHGSVARRLAAGRCCSCGRQGPWRRARTCRWRRDRGRDARLRRRDG